MNTTAVEQPADFVLHILSTIFSVQNEAFERMQKLTHLNVAALKAVLAEGQATLLSSSKSALPPVSDAVASSQRFAERALSYSVHVREINSQFMAAVTRAGEDLSNQYSAIWTGAATNLSQVATFGSDTAVTTMQSAIGAMMRTQGTIQKSVSHGAHADASPIGV